MLDINQALLSRVKLELHRTERRYKQVNNRVKTLKRQQACKHAWIVNKKTNVLYCPKCSRSYEV